MLRLEIERPPDAGELVNLVPNPDGTLGAWGWETPVAGSVLRSLNTYGVRGLVYTSPGGVASHFNVEPMPVTPGQYVAARWVTTFVTGLYSVQVEWLNTTKALISSTTASANYPASSGSRAYGSYVAPAGAAYFRLRFDHYDGSGGNPAAGTQMTVREVVATAASSAGDLAVTLNNLLPTPSAEGGVQGWYAKGGADVGTTTAQSWDGTHSFTIAKTGSAGPAELISASIVVQSGRDYALQARSRSDGVERKVTVSARWYDASGTLISTVPVKTKNEVNDAWTVPIAGVATAPTNAARLRLVVQYGNMAEGETHYVDACMVEQASKPGGYFDGATADVLGYTFDWTGAPYASASIAVGPTGDPGVLVPVTYQNILGPTGRIAIDREDLNVGSMSVTLYDAILDPTQTDLVRPGKRIRLVSVDDGNTEVIFAGKTFTANVTYHLLERDENKRAEVTLTAVDPINALASAPRREGVATIAELPYVLEGAGVPWSCNGSGDQVATADVVAYNDNASALDQVAVTRDSALGYAWVDRNGVLQAWDRTELDATVAADLDETTYTADIDIDFDLERIINSVTVKVLRVIATSGATEEVSFGPYIDADSIKAWGEHSAEYVVQGFDVADTTAIVAYANAILAANATPHQRVNSLVLGIESTADLPKAQLDLYDLVHVVNDRGNIDENSRIISMRHEITATKTGGTWKVTLGFVKDGSVAASTAVPSPPPGVGDVKDEIDTSLTELYARADENAAAAAEAAANGTAAMTAANGKNKVTYSSSGPGSTPNNPGDIWWQRSGGLIYGQWEGLGGTSWASRTLAGAVIAYLDAGQLTAGSAFINGLSVKTNFTLGDASTNGVIQSYNFAGSSVGVYIDKYGLVAKGGTIAAAAITGGSISGTSISGVSITGSSLSTSGSYPITISGSGVGWSSGAGIFETGISLTMQRGSNAVQLSSTGIDLTGTTNCSGVFHAYRLETDVSTTGAAANTHMDSNGRLFQSTSSRRHKYDIVDADLDPTVAQQLRVTTHRRYDDPEYDEADPGAGRLYLSLIAEEVAELSPWLATYDAEGEPNAIDWQAVALYTLATVKDLAARIEILEGS